MTAWEAPVQPGAWIAWLDSGEWERSLNSYTPMIPANAVEIANLARDPDVSAVKLTQAIGKDPILAANVIRLANSAFSASSTTITTLSDAVVRVGTRSVRQLVTAACLTSKLRNPKTYGTNARMLVDHSVGTAYIAWLVADHMDEDPDSAFLCGLLHDIGKFVILKLAYEDHPIPPTMSEARLNACVEERHAAVGQQALARWDFAPEIQLPVAWHHDPGQAHGHLHVAAIVYAANRLAHRYGCGCEPDASDLFEDDVFQRLGFDDGFMQELDAKVPGPFEVARRIRGGQEDRGVTSPACPSRRSASSRRTAERPPASRR